jgi:hypothetical protein
MRQTWRRLTTLFLLALLAGGCATTDLGPVPGSDGHQDDGDDVHPLPDDAGVGNPDDPEHPGGLLVAGRYELVSIVDLAGANAFGDTISGTLVQLSMFHDNPAGTVLELMAIYQVPYYTQIWGILPGFIKNALEGWINDILFDTLFEAIPALDQAVQVVDDVASVSRNVQMTTEMTLRGPFGTKLNLLRGEHKMKGLGFTLWSYHAYIPLPGQLSDVISLDVRGELDKDNLPKDSAFRLAFNKQDFNIPYGDMIMDAIAVLVFMPVGAADLGSYLNVLINCPSVASWLGNRCIFGACLKDLVSIEDISGFCHDGLGIVGFVVETAVRSLKLDLIDLENGKCVLYDKGYGDTEGDGKIDAIADGQWETTIRISSTSKKVMAPFEGRRIADE